MKISLGSAIVIAVVVYTALCYRDEECGPDSVARVEDGCCYPIICSDGTVIEAEFNYKAYVYIKVDKEDGKCIPFGNNSEPKCTKDDRMFSYYIDWDHNTPGSYNCSRGSSYYIADVETKWGGYPHVKKTYTVQILYCYRTESGKQCCSPPFTKNIDVKP